MVTCLFTICVAALGLVLFIKLGECTPTLIFDRQGDIPTDPNRNRVDLTCREDGVDIRATFWNGTTQLNPLPSPTHTHDLTPDTEAEIACSNQNGLMSDEIRLAALPEEQNLQDNPPRNQRVRQGEIVELPCDYRPGNLRELYEVFWSVHELGGGDVLYRPDTLPLGDLLSIDEDTFSLTVAVNQTGDQFHCTVDVRLNNIGSRRLRYEGATIELKDEAPVATVEPTTSTDDDNASDDSDVSEEVRTLIFVLSGIVAFVIIVIIVVVSCVCSLRILYKQGKITTDSRVIRNRPLLQRMVSGERYPRINRDPNEYHNHDYEHMNAKLSSLPPGSEVPAHFFQPSDVSNQERIYNLSCGSGSIPGSHADLQQPFNRGSYAESESGFYRKLFPYKDSRESRASEIFAPSAGHLSTNVGRMSPTPRTMMLSPGSPNHLSPMTTAIPESASPAPLSDDILRAISLSADNLPALCLNDCPLTPFPLRENRTLMAAAMSPLRRSRWVHKPKFGTLAENSLSAESLSNVSSHIIRVSDSDFNEEATTSASSSSQIANVSIPFTDTIKYGSAGGMYINQMHDVTIKIPEKAVPKGTYFQLSISAMLNGPFLFPEGVRPVSSILWLCPHPTLTFSKPIEVVLPHYVHCENQADTEHLIFMKANHHPKNGKFHFKPADGEGVFKHHTSYGALHTKHCCFLCITAKTTERETPKINFSLITAYPRNPQEHSWSVYFGVTVLMSSCMQTFREQFKDADYQINKPQIFKMQDATEKRIKICYQEHLPQQWMVGLSGSDEVLASEVDFWNYTPTDLKTMEDEKMYPPRFEVLINGHGAVGDSMLTVNFSGIKKELMVKIPLRLAAVAPNGGLARPDKQPQPVTDVAEEPNDAIDLRELCLELQTVNDWFDLGIYLHIPYSKLKIIEVEYHNIHRRRTEMLQFWLNNFQPSWSAVIEALKLVDMSQLAKTLAAKKKVSGSFHFPPSPTYRQAYSPTHSQGHSDTHLRGHSPTHQMTHHRLIHHYQTSRTDHNIRSHRLSEAVVTETLC